MRRLSIIGIGAGDPDHLTVQAIKALRNLDVVFLIDKGEEKHGLARLRTEICQRHIENKSCRIVTAKDPERDRAPSHYENTVAAWHAERATIYEKMIRDELRDDQHGAFLVWGDPSLYDSTLRVVELVLAMGTVAFEYDVIPGITSVQALAARHRIALNRIGEAVHITTGRRLAKGWPADVTTAVVMLDGEGTFKAIKDDGAEIYWGAYLGTPEEIVASGKLSERGPEIETLRNDARARHGWIMDIYLLRKPTRP